MQIIKICFRCWCYVTVPEIWHLTYVVFIFQNAKMAQNDKKFCLSSYSMSQKLCIICSSFMVHMCKMISLGIFSFFQNLIFWVVRGSKRAKNGPKFCLSRSISQEPYMIWLSLMVHICKIILCPWTFFIFSKFWFSRLLEGSKGKIWPKMTKKISLFHSVSQELYIIWFYGAMA